MANTIHPVDATAGAPLYSGRMLRQVASVAFAGATAARPFGVLSGVRPGTKTTTVYADATTWYVQPHAGVLDLEAAVESGCTLYAIDATVVGAMRPADGFARVDLVWVRQDIPLEDGSAAPAVVPGYTYGTAPGTPPATPARCMVLAWVNVPASGGGAPTVTWKAPYAVGAYTTAVREVPVAISGILATALDLAAAQTLPAGPYAVRINASISATVPAGVGIQLDVMLDGVVKGTFKATNAGASANTITVAVNRTIAVTDALTHIVRAVVTPLGGNVTITADAARFFEIHTSPYQAL